MSKLHVEVCEIDVIEDLENADRMQMATVKGWQCLIQKNQYKEGDSVIFIPPDAVLPDSLIEELDLSYLRGKGRVKTVKLRGYISQGLVLSSDILIKKGIKHAIGYDCAEVLGIKKYVPPFKGLPTPKRDTFFNLWKKFQAKEITLGRLLRKSFALTRDHFRPKKKVNPDFDVYTDLDNIKHYPDVFEVGEEVIITEKIHGTNFRAGMLPLHETVIGRIKQFFTGKTHEFVYGSHRVQKTVLGDNGWYGEDVYGKIAEKYKLKDIIPEGYILYGEIYGHKIQELNYGLEDSIDVVFFDIKFNGMYLNWDQVLSFCESNNLPTVPVIYEGKYSQDTLKHCTSGLTELNGCPHIREGCVVKPLEEGYSNRCGRKILKSISAEYLLTKKQENPEEVVDDSAEYPH